MNEDEAPFYFPPWSGPKPFRVGGVDYSYRMTTTEVTVGHWLEFVNGYAPYYDGPRNDSDFTSNWIRWDSQSDRYTAQPGTEGFAANMNWRYAARYVNWLHNDKGLDQASFEDGAYDTSTFGTTPDGRFTDQHDHHPDARFWIPTVDEWIKAMYWDPKKDSEGGYWKYPHSSNEPPVPGPPGEGDTSTDLAGGYGFVPAGSYPHATSPWGLLDGSGGVSEWLEGVTGESAGRFVHGSAWFDSTVRHDEIDRISASSPSSSSFGLRIASIPAPPATAVMALVMIHSRRRR